MALPKRRKPQKEPKARRPCAKVNYETHRLALKAKLKVAGKKRRKHRNLQVYWCQGCKAWHLGRPLKW